jgi:hypothetical protein
LHLLLHVCRLPDLTALDVKVERPPRLDMLPMAMLMLSVRTELTCLPHLTLELSHIWDGAGLAWAELAAMTQLTRLHISCTFMVSACFRSHSPAGLSNRTRQPRRVEAEAALAQTALLCWQSCCVESTLLTAVVCTGWLS